MNILYTVYNFLLYLWAFLKLFKTFTMVFICGLWLFSEVRVKVGRSHGVEDRRSRHCPYLDTINRYLNDQDCIYYFNPILLFCYSTLFFFFFFFRSVLDFDFEKLCSISLSHINVYACLICGKYFQGKSDR